MTVVCNIFIHELWNVCVWVIFFLALFSTKLATDLEALILSHDIHE